MHFILFQLSTLSAVVKSKGGKYLNTCLETKIYVHVQMFLWKIGPKGLPSDYKLKWDAYNRDIMCLWYKKVIETYVHALFNCEWVGRVWFLSSMQMTRFWLAKTTYIVEQWRPQRKELPTNLCYVINSSYPEA